MKNIVLAGLVLAFLAGSLTVTAEEQGSKLRSQLFAEADRALESAHLVRADLLAPGSYAKGERYYSAAEDKLARQKSIEDISEDLADASEYFKQAVRASRLAQVTFADVLLVRAAAETAEASTYAAELWQETEETFAQAARRLEGGNVNSARKKADVAVRDYSNTELVAIKNRYLGEVRQLLRQAEREKVAKLAPNTLSAGQSLLQRAEETLDADRYNVEAAQTLVQQARYETEHARQLVQILQPVKEREMSLEELALSFEQSLIKVAAALDLSIGFDRGLDLAAEKIAGHARLLREQSLELGVRREEVADLENEVRNMELRLGTQSDRINEQNQLRQKFAQLDSAFDSDEALVYRQGSNLLIRMVGLNFDTGAAAIPSQHFSLLRKVIDAIRLFPGASMTVEGHTDSLGTEISNINLSQQRADAVAEYLKANMTELSDSSVNAVGYGESRPVANNETAEGRKTNRRIDLLIKPAY